jgi:hypothetical protein
MQEKNTTFFSKNTPVFEEPFILRLTKAPF